MANTTLAIPLVVKNAMFTLLRSVGFTNRCWYTSKPPNTIAPTQYSQPKRPNQPAVAIQEALKTCSHLLTNSALDLPSQTGIDCS